MLAEMSILTTAGVLQGGIITPAARQSFVDDVVNLLRVGDRDSMFGSLPPALRFDGEPFLCQSFDVSPISAHAATFPTWHKVFIDVMFQAVANALDVDGAVPLSPVLDYTVPFAGLGLPRKTLDIQEFVVGMALVDPTFQMQLQYFFDVDVDDITPELLLDISLAVPVPTPPTVPVPPVGISPADLIFEVPVEFPPMQVPTLTTPLPPPLAFPGHLPVPAVGFVLCAVVEAVPKIFAILVAKALAGELIKALAAGPAGIVTFVAAVVVEAIASCLGVELRNLLTFLAGFVVYIERLVAMLAVVLVGSIFGEGQLVVLLAQALKLT